MVDGESSELLPIFAISSEDGVCTRTLALPLSPSLHPSISLSLLCVYLSLSFRCPPPALSHRCARAVCVVRASRGILLWVEGADVEGTDEGADEVRVEGLAKPTGAAFWSQVCPLFLG